MTFFVLLAYNFQITDVKWLPNSQLALTIYNFDAGGDPNLMVHAIGHYTFGGDKGHSHRFLKDPEFVNTHHCDDNSDTQVNPYTDTRSYDPVNTPVKGEWVGIWLQVYWSCNSNGRGGSVNCCSKPLFINTPYKPSA